MQNIKTTLRQLGSDGSWNYIFILGMTDTIVRSMGEGQDPTQYQSLEDVLTEIETELAKRVNGTATIYKSLAEINESLTTASAVSEVCEAMVDGSIAMYYVDLPSSGNYPGTGTGVSVIVKITNQYCICFYNDTTNTLRTAIYSNNGVDPAIWSGWKENSGGGGGGNSTVISSTEPVDQIEGDLWFEPIS